MFYLFRWDRPRALFDRLHAVLDRLHFVAGDSVAEVVDWLFCKSAFRQFQLKSFVSNRFEQLVRRIRNCFGIQTEER